MGNPMGMTGASDNSAGVPLVIEHAGVRIDRYGHRAFVHGRELRLTPREFRVLECFVGQPGRAWTREDLAALVLRRPVKYVRTIDRCVMELRRKLGRRALIVTVQSVGYRLGGTGDAKGDLPLRESPPAS
jgi:DNA-binding response OmpR family regulator